MLVALGAGLGWLFARQATEALSSWSGLELILAPDRRVLWFTLAVSVLAALIFGLVPLRRAVRVPVSAALKTAASAAHQDRDRTWGRKAVITLQVALCLTLLAPAGLLVQTLHNLEQIPLGMRTTGLLVFGITPQQQLAASHLERVRFYEGLMNRLRNVSGVESVTLMENRIGSGWSNNTNAFIDGRPHEGQNTLMRWNSVGPDYFHTLRTPILYRRDIRESDAFDARRVAVVNETFVKRYLAGKNPLDHSIAISLRPGDAQFRIVGVAADSKYTGVREEALPMAYFSYKQMEHISAMHIELRTAGEPTNFLPAVQRAVREFAPDVPLEQLKTQQQQFETTFAQDRLFARLALFFGVLAMLLVATGLYGTLAYKINRRTSEIGVRMALGAQRRHVLWMVLRESLGVFLAGIGIGLPLAIAGSRLLQSMLYGVAPGDPGAFGMALAGLLLVAISASALPARRAASVDPAVALRTE